MSEKTVFVTVGTTSFDDLIETVTTDPVLTELRALGYTKILLQIGCGETEPTTTDRPLALEYFRYRPNLNSVIDSSHLIISHAGAGTILESLEASKPLVVVVNSRLMNNHQTELARQFNKDGYLVYCRCETLLPTIRSFDAHSLNRYRRGDPSKFTNFLNKFVNYE